jgi:membrane-associated protein
VRTFAPFLAGVSRMPFGQYCIAANVGTSFWIASLMLAGYFFGEIPFVREHMASIILSGLGIGLACIIIGASLSNKKQKP